jgi:hypothetical protein
MKQYRRKITATASAILIALTLVGLNTDQAIAQGKAGKSVRGELVMEGHIKKAGKVAKAPADSNAKISKKPRPKQTITMMDYEGSPVVTYSDKGKMTPTNAKILRTPGSAKRTATSTSNLQNAENVRSQSERRRRR